MGALTFQAKDAATLQHKGAELEMEWDRKKMQDDTPLISSPVNAELGSRWAAPNFTRSIRKISAKNKALETEPHF